MQDLITVLLVDDKEDYCKSLQMAARNEGFKIVYELNWESGFERLKKEQDIEFLILDGKGKIDSDQEVERDNFVVRAMRDIDEYSNSIWCHIPYCVNTGFMDRFETLDGNVEIFTKMGEGQKAMFRYIKSEVEKTEYRTFKKQFGEAFEAFDRGMISKNYQRLLIDVLRAYQEKDFRKKNVTIQRDLFEAILLNMNRPIPFLSDDFIDRRDLPNQEWCVRYIEGRKLFINDIEISKHDKNIPQNIQSSFRKLKESTNGYSHLSDDDIVKIPFLANTFLLLEILEWIPRFVDKYYKDYF